jgi:hypothetical protein
MKKALLLILAVGNPNVTVLSPASATETAGVLPMRVENAGQYYAADYRLERRAYRYTHRLSNYPYFRGYTSVADPWWPGSSGRCGYGSYVACVNAGQFCWQRCY